MPEGVVVLPLSQSVALHAWRAMESFRPCKPRERPDTRRARAVFVPCNAAADYSAARRGSSCTFAHPGARSRSAIVILVQTSRRAGADIGLCGGSSRSALLHLHSLRDRVVDSSRLSACATHQCPSPRSLLQVIVRTCHATTRTQTTGPLATAGSG